MVGTLILTHGLSGSGKSTWAKEYAIKHSNTVIIERDEIREHLYGREYHKRPPVKKKEQKVTYIQDTLTKESLAKGETVIHSDTNVSPQFLTEKRKLTESSGANLKQQYFDCRLHLLTNIE